MKKRSFWISQILFVTFSKTKIVSKTRPVKYEQLTTRKKDLLE